MEPRHERITKVALAAGARYGLALAGGYAVQAHGMGTRPSGDVDLFTSWQHRGEFPELTTAVIGALESAGYVTSIVMRAETFVRLMVTDPADGVAEKVELSADWRAHEPVQLDIGPVLHADDAIANKVCALFGRALPRDFLDVDAAIVSGATRASSCSGSPPQPTTPSIACFLPMRSARSLRSPTPHSLSIESLWTRSQRCVAASPTGGSSSHSCSLGACRSRSAWGPEGNLRCHQRPLDRRRNGQNGQSCRRGLSTKIPLHRSGARVEQSSLS